MITALEDLRLTQPETISIGEASATVVEHTRTVHGAQKLLSSVG